MWRSPMKICGKVARPLARWTISWRFSGSKAASISLNATPFFSSSDTARMQ